MARRLAPRTSEGSEGLFMEAKPSAVGLRERGTNECLRPTPGRLAPVRALAHGPFAAWRTSALASRRSFCATYTTASRARPMASVA